MNCTLLGTSSAIGIPAPLCDNECCKNTTRMRPSLLIESGNDVILFDVSPDVNKQLHNKVSHIDAIFLTHHHHDHATGLQEINHTTLSKDSVSMSDLQFEINSWLGQDYDIYCSVETENELVSNITYIMNDKSINTININDNEPIVIGDIKITPFIAEHSIGYMGYIIEDDEKSIVYHPDYGKLRTDVEFNNIDVLVTDGSSALGYDIHGTREQFNNLINRINADKILFTNVSEHISQKTTSELVKLGEKWDNSVVEDGYKF